MDLQTMGGKPVTSDNALSHNNLRAHSPQTAGDSRPQPDTPIGLEESWRNANSCARCRSPGCAVPYEDPQSGPSAGSLRGEHDVLADFVGAKGVARRDDPPGVHCVQERRAHGRESALALHWGPVTSSDQAHSFRLSRIVPPDLGEVNHTVLVPLPQ